MQIIQTQLSKCHETTDFRTYHAKELTLMKGHAFKISNQAVRKGNFKRFKAEMQGSVKLKHPNQGQGIHLEQIIAMLRRP